MQSRPESHRIHGAAIYGNIYHQYTPNVSIYTIHGSYGIQVNFSEKLLDAAPEINAGTSVLLSGSYAAQKGSPPWRSHGLVLQLPEKYMHANWGSSSHQTGNIQGGTIINYPRLTKQIGHSQFCRTFNCYSCFFPLGGDFWAIQCLSGAPNTLHTRWANLVAIFCLQWVGAPMFIVAS